MPYFSIDEETYDEWREMAGDAGGDIAAQTAGFEHGTDGQMHSYQPAQAQFTPGQLDEVSQFVCEMLQGMGVIAVRCQYDGGGDEGFAYFGEAFVGSQSLSAQELAAQLADAESAQTSPVIPEHLRSYYANLPPVERAKSYLDDFANELATLLLGEGYGTGDYSMHGSFKADFQTGEIMDEPEDEQETK
ncbi:MAG: hypothetical protein JO316_00840 [Abitibacteriaceae bacterium]|nr:hypothetical protein [Abditibacteriaceae bacterium]